RQRPGRRPRRRAAVHHTGADRCRPRSRAGDWRRHLRSADRRDREAGERRRGREHGRPRGARGGPDASGLSGGSPARGARQGPARRLHRDRRRDAGRAPRPERSGGARARRECEDHDPGGSPTCAGSRPLVTRVGFGFDLHPLRRGRPLVLGGVTLESEAGLDGHSDADVLSHAVGEALLGALAMGDLGRHFPDTDPRYRGTSSLMLLEKVMDLVRSRGGRLVNVDATVLAQAPRLQPHLEEMAKRLTFAKNFTEVDDKIITRAQAEGVSAREVSERYVAEFYRDMEAIGVLRGDVEPKATDHIGQMIRLIEQLVAAGVAYVVDGDVYFEISRFPAYGRLSGKNLDELLAGARVEVDERKRDPRDFALWKAAKPGEP